MCRYVTNLCGLAQCAHLQLCNVPRWVELRTCRGREAKRREGIREREKDVSLIKLFLSTMLWRERFSCYFKQITSLSNAAAPLSVSEFLKNHETEFFTVINPRQSLLRLIRKGVITEDVQSSIDTSNTKDALEILYDHLKRHGSMNTLLEYCEMTIDADGLSNMQSFGRRMKEQLQHRGWLANVCVCVCVCSVVVCSQVFCACDSLLLCVCASWVT